MVELGRTAITDSQLATTLTTLEQGGFYERFLAIHACSGNRDGAHVLRSLTDPSRIIRGLAINLTTLVCDEEQLRQALTLVPRDGRRALLWKLHHHDSQGIIDEFLAQLVQTDDPQVRELLPHGSLALVRQHIARLQATLRLADWRRLARHHPIIACELLQARAATTTRLDLQLVAWANGILPILAQKQPDSGVMLVEALAHSIPLNRLNLHALLLQRPIAIADLALQHADIGDMQFYYVVHKLDYEHLRALQEKYPDLISLSRTRHWKKLFTVEERANLSLEFFAFLRDERTCLPLEILELVPRAQRAEEARRCLGLPILAARPEERLSYAAFLPWDEAYEILEPFLHDPGETLRMLAIQTLTRVVRYEHARLPEVLAIIQTHLHEPDPARETMLRSLATLPRNIWRTEHLSTFEQIAQDVIAPADTSANTVGALLLLLTRLLDCTPQWSITRFTHIFQIHHFIFRFGDLNKLSVSDIRLLGPALQPALNALAQKGDEETLHALYSTFRKHLRVFDELLSAFELALSKKLSAPFGNALLAILTKYRPARAAQLIPEIMQKNEGTWLYPAILLYAHTQRQDLLTALLADSESLNRIHHAKKETKRRPRGRKRQEQLLMNGFARWTLQQQTTFAQTLLQVINDETSPHPVLKRAIARLAALPAISTHHLIALATDPRPVVREFTIMHLNKLDDTTPMLPTLLEALHDERAVKAMYALRPFLLSAPPPQALAILRTIPLTKVTMAKEVVRLLGELSGEAAFQELLALERQELHRDVRAALLRALWRHMGRDEAWHILEQAAKSSDKIALNAAHLSMGQGLAKNHRARRRFARHNTPSALYQFFWFGEWNAITLTHLSGEQLSALMQSRLMRLFGILLTHPEPDVRNAVLRMCIRLSAADDDQMLLEQLLKAMDANENYICTAAASAIFGTCAASDAQTIGQGIARLLPNRRALLSIVLTLQSMLPLNRQQLIPVMRAVMAALATDPLTLGLRIELAITSLPWDEVATMLSEAAATGALHADALSQACDMLRTVRGRYGNAGRPDSKEMSRLETMLATSQDERLRRIALAALVVQAEASKGWSAEQRARLEVYRADTSPLVAAAAQFTDTGPEV